MTNTLQITHDKQFLRRFLTKERVLQLCDDEVEKLRQASAMGDAFAQYAYGRWLYLYNPYEGAINDAEGLFFSSKDLVPDSMAAYAQMLRYGETETTHPSAIDIQESMRLAQEAVVRGSELAANQLARHRIFGNICQAEPAKVAEEIVQRQKDDPDSDPSWYTMLAFAYEETGQREKAIQCYEQAIAQGELDAYFYLAFLYQQRGNMALYEEYMEEGCEKGALGCHIYQTDMTEEQFQEYSETEQQHIHQTIDGRLRLGLKKGEGLCAYYLWYFHYYGELGYPEDSMKAFAYLKRGVQLGCHACISEMAMEAQQNELPDQSLTAYDKAELWLKVARYIPDDEDALYYLQRVNDPAFLLKHKDELEQYRQPRFKTTETDQEEADDTDYDEDDGRYDAYA